MTDDSRRDPIDDLDQAFAEIRRAIQEGLALTRRQTDLEERHERHA